jgi:TPR repeat protein
MTTVPGTCFTKEQLEVDLKGNGYYYFFLHSHSNQANELTFTVDNVSDGGNTGSNRMREIGYVYYSDKKQYDKTLAWYLLAARENDSKAQNNIGVFYYNGWGVPQNYLCTLKWLLKSVEQNRYESNPNTIGWLFENGQGVPPNKYKALEWYCHGEDKTYRDSLKSEGYHLSAADMGTFNYITDSLY